MREQTDQFKFHFSDIGMPLRIAAVAILSVLSIIAVGGTVRYAASLPKETTPQANQNTNTNQGNAPVNTQNNPNITAPQSGSGASSGTVVRCNTTQKATYTNQYNNQVAEENARHQNVINFLTSTGAPQSAFDSENATHAQNLASIYSQYQSNLRSIGC